MKHDPYYIRSIILLLYAPGTNYYDDTVLAIIIIVAALDCHTIQYGAYRTVLGGNRYNTQVWIGIGPVPSCMSPFRDKK